MQRGASQGQCCSCKWGAGPWGVGSRSQGCSGAHAVTPAKPSVARDLQGSPRARCCTSTQATQPAAGNLLPSMQRETTRRDPTWPPCPRPKSVASHPPFLCVPSAPGSKKSFPSLARSPQPLAFKMSRQTYITLSKKHVSWANSPAGAMQRVGDGYISALEAMNSFIPGYNSTVMCLSLKERNPSAGYFSGSTTILFKEVKSLSPDFFFF